MTHSYFGWFSHLHNAACHSTAALDFVYKDLLHRRSKGGSSAELADMDNALRSYEIIVEQGLVYKVGFGYGHEPYETLENTVAVFSRLCPKWRTDPYWILMDFDRHITCERDRQEFGPALTGDDGQIRPEVLFERLQGSYRVISAFVNKEAATHIRLFYGNPYVHDYTNLMETALRLKQEMNQ